MYIDKLMQVSSAQALTAAAASTDVIDLGGDRDIGPGRPLWLVVVARVALAGTLSIAIQTDDNSAFASPTTLITSQTFTAAEVPAGKVLAFGMPMTNERYLRASYGGLPTAGTFDAWFTDQEPATWAAQPDAL
jgi:hypothetical protein